MFRLRRFSAALHLPRQQARVMLMAPRATPRRFYGARLTIAFASEASPYAFRRLRRRFADGHALA
jgi:hypothetical protein